MSKLEPITATAPSHWASYLVNGDASGLDAEDKAQAEKFVQWLGAWPCSCEDAGFMWTHDAMRVCGTLASDCQTYTALIETEESEDSEGQDRESYSDDQDRESYT